MYTKNLTRSKNIFKKGFTILELIVVIAIMAIMTAIILYNNQDLNSSLLVSNTAYEINLIIREAQVYGLGVKAGGNTQADFRYSQGVHFDLAYPTQVIIFSDSNNSGNYNTGEEIQSYNITNKRAGQILSICSPTGNGTGCDPLPPEADNKLDILFKRPNPEPVFSAGGANGRVNINLGSISDSNFCRSVIVEKTGAIQINKFYCL